MATNFKTELLEKRLKIDLIAGPDSYKALPNLLNNNHSNQSIKPFDVTLSVETYESILPSRTDGANAWVAIMRAAITSARFVLFLTPGVVSEAKSIQSVLDEVNQLVDAGLNK